MKNILLALASFLVTFAFLFQVANAQEVDGWPPRSSSNPPASGENRTDDLVVKGNNTEGDIVNSGKPCSACEAHTVGANMNSKTNPKGSGAGSKDTTDTSGSKSSRGTR